MKIIRTTLMMAAIGALSLGAFGCSKKDDKKDQPEPTQKVTEEGKAEAPAPTEEKKAPEAPKAEEAAAGEEKAEEAAAGEEKAEEAAGEEKAEEAPAEKTE